MGAIIPWLTEQERELTRLFQTLFEGVYWSHALIAHTLGKSRNAVVGKIHRLNLTRDPLIPCMGVDGRIVAQELQKAITVPRVPATYGRHGRSAPPRAPTGAGEIMSERSPYAVQILECTDNTCKFPVGHVGHEGFHLCGDKVGNRAPYCVHHASICYIPLKERQKQWAIRV